MVGLGSVVGEPGGPPWLAGAVAHDGGHLYPDTRSMGRQAVAVGSVVQNAGMPALANRVGVPVAASAERREYWVGVHQNWQGVHLDWAPVAASAGRGKHQAGVHLGLAPVDP